MADTGDDRRSVSAGIKFDQDKPRMDLLDAYAIEQLALVLTFGAKKYAAENWRKGISIKRLIASSLRHLLAIMIGQDNDEETGLAHSAHLMCNAMFITWLLKHNRQWDDRWISEVINTESLLLIPDEQMDDLDDRIIGKEIYKSPDGRVWPRGKI